MPAGKKTMHKAVPRVAITGLGMICPVGTTAVTCWAALLAGRSGIGRIRGFDVGDCETTFGGELPEAYESLEASVFPARKRKQTELTTRLGFLCAREAIADSGFAIAGLGLEPARCAVITGCGSISSPESGRANRPADPRAGTAQYLIIRQMPNALSGWLSIELGAKGRSYNVSTACASGAFAIAQAYEYISGGRGDAAVAVGMDALLNAASIDGFNALGAMSTRNDDPAAASRPFEARRDGLVLANGGAAVVLEAESLARRRGARIYAYLVGAAMTSEAFNIVAPQPAGMEMDRCMTLALSDAGRAPEQVGYISAHGTSTQQNDADETASIKRVFGRHAYRLAVSAQKSMTGHTIGGAGAIECAVTALSLYHEMLTPTINHQTSAPECDLDYVPNCARAAPGLCLAISNSFGFGGHNSTLVLERA